MAASTTTDSVEQTTMSTDNSVMDSDADQSRTVEKLPKFDAEMSDEEPAFASDKAADLRVGEALLPEEESKERVDEECVNYGISFSEPSPEPE